MNVKALAAIVGTLSLGALATGCASNKAAEGTPTEAKGADSQCSGQKAADPAAAPAATPEKGAEGKCGAGSCSGNK